MRLFTGTSVSAEKEKIPWCKVEMITFNLIVDIVKFVVCSKTLWWRALRERERERERETKTFWRMASRRGMFSGWALMVCEKMTNVLSSIRCSSGGCFTPAVVRDNLYHFTCSFSYSTTCTATCTNLTASVRVHANIYYHNSVSSIHWACTSLLLMSPHTYIHMPVY